MQTRWSRFGRNVLLGKRTHEVAGRPSKVSLAVDSERNLVLMSARSSVDGTVVTVELSGDEVRRAGTAMIEAGVVLDAEVSGVWSQR